MTDSLVIIPTYNEKENIEKIIRKVFSLSQAFDILIVDDGSPDGTATIIKNLQANEFTGRLFIEERTGKLGLGTAYIHGFKWALSREHYQYIFEMDADFSHNPEDLLRLRQACVDGADMSIGSRYIKGVNVVNWPMSRVLMSYFASVYVRFITGIAIQDATAGFVCFSREVLKTIPLEKIKFVGYAFQIEMKFTAIKYGFNVVEVPIIFTDRTEGTSKMSTSIFKEAFFGVIQLKLGSIGKRYKRN
ncbi:MULTISPECIES: polyprenol monophosphomannose synthase [Sphingobacterium]|uniref:Polyprenol monophosphomannose synthase n=1 Tax=Sphingobacterium multivorum TaxID=28454 RepID=A0ABX7D0V8_SPHMU|nr:MULTISPECIES: polyprenol monophosphomannose synthase [Sphingobacterium]APU99783.1 dolichyl-phosphate beta-D-mannosyltransferase [Sphingobacterium sp. B29]QQT56362.1 polyprenol monophosphomannose synthase [Sphingobacterium multivorum]QRY60730.1 polyprenol monophosphomannose synthase [Sphingobacterium siyangense]UQA78046.1 polyprenol monophosphomannose synthase [Sphingobacterium siyangense]